MMYDPGLDFEAGKKKAIKGTETSDRIWVWSVIYIIFITVVWLIREFLVFRRYMTMYKKVNRHDSNLSLKWFRKNLHNFMNT
jgi:hypothetical protein